jgi:hypothetical protein
LSSRRNRSFEWTALHGPVDSARWDFGVDEVVGEPERHTEHEQNAANEQAAFGEHAREVANETQIARQEDFDDQHIERRQRRRFHRRRQAAEQRRKRDERRQEFPFRDPQRRARLRPGRRDLRTDG